ncbi:hypothetical protein [Paraburkholderia humisilvae]|uniref:Uncharacterized protein n=1 Tax=Paraburkholderia humisilvae TaxID=627669 RepID=A0A6J5DN22_9BURK|nr:hypothetical protein [Paraburkholderia humisilvae]CAB3754602.1 hypothetical protein LMG29542_02395 [Paraburkholderia humisilvae]
MEGANNVLSEKATRVFATIDQLLSRQNTCGCRGVGCPACIAGTKLRSMMESQRTGSEPEDIESVETQLKVLLDASLQCHKPRYYDFSLKGAKRELAFLTVGSAGVFLACAANSFDNPFGTLALTLRIVAGALLVGVALGFAIIWTFRPRSAPKQ